MITPDNPYYRQVQLLVRVLPYVAREQCFALKGGTAINLFIRDLPRLSVDIDLAYMPLSGYDESRREIDAAMRRIADDLSAGSPAFAVTLGANDGAGLIDTLNVSDGARNIKIEVNPVLRGAVNPPSMLALRPLVQEQFGFAEVNSLAFEDIYAGKLMAAIDRQHPRDLFDALVLLEKEGISDRLFETWLVYLVGHKGNMADTLDPNRKNIEHLFRSQFVTMTDREISLQQLIDVREHLINELRGRLGDRHKTFLLSVKRGEPRWDLINFKEAGNLPAVAWKLHNIGRMKPEAHKRAIERLEKVLNAIR